MPRRAGVVRELSDLLPLWIPQVSWKFELLSLRKHKETRADPGRGTVSVGESNAGHWFLEFNDSGPGAGVYRLRARRVPPSEDRFSDNMRWLVGRWNVRYASSATRVYDIALNGKIANLTEKTAGEVRARDDHWLIDLHDGKLERLRFDSLFDIAIQHYDPAANYPNGSAATSGKGQKLLVPLE